MNLLLLRDTMDLSPTLGEISYNGEKLTESVERAWLNNKRQVSCIPEGVYEFVVLKNGSSKFQYPCLLLKNVPGRSAIMMHRANYASELRGCIAPGMKRNGLSVQNSTAALQKIIDVILKNGITHIEVRKK